MIGCASLGVMYVCGSGESKTMLKRLNSTQELASKAVARYVEIWVSLITLMATLLTGHSVMPERAEKGMNEDAVIWGRIMNVVQA